MVARVSLPGLSVELVIARVVVQVEVAHRVWRVQVGVRAQLVDSP